MTEMLAALLLVSGAAIALIAAIGVARLPDAFLRMHAATKAGVVGCSLMLLGAGFAFGTPEAWLRIAAIVIFLLITVPISSHALGRAAYLGGAAMWSGTQLDELKGVLPRHGVDETPAQDIPPGEPAAMSHSSPAGPSHRRILLALAQGPESEAALEAGLRAVAVPQAEVTLLSLLCAPSLAQTGPVPLGGAHYARRLIETRLARAREQAGLLAQHAAAVAETAGLPATTRHEEGDALRLLLRAAAHHDVAILPRGAWFDQAQVLPEGMAEARARSLALPGLLLATPALAAIRQLHFLHEADEASGAALKRFLGLGVFARLPLTITILDLPGAPMMLAEAMALATSRGRMARAGYPSLHPDHPAPLEAFSGATLAVIPAESGSGRAAWRSLREMPHALLLA
jgi:monovalent cation/proton antiporter MnhG/PhaG subunit